MTQNAQDQTDTRASAAVGSDMPDITVVVLTFNEEQHIERALASVADFARHCLVVDSGSTDDTVALAEAAGAEVRVNPFVTQAQQFNWALCQLPADTDWVLRLDADEYITPSLAQEILATVPKLGPETVGVLLPRRMTFLQHPIRWGGVFPVQVLRLFRYGHGRCENRWMDEHIVVDGATVALKGELIDDNLNTLTWWTAKHNAYAARETVDQLNRQYRFMEFETLATEGGSSGRQATVKRWMKETIYGRLPGGSRAAAYFFYRFVLRLGFLDGRMGASFHVLQGFWYRYLVDMKMREVKAHMERTGDDPVAAIDKVLGIKVGGRWNE